MSLLLKSTLLASVAAAQLTTSIWMPGAANGDQSFVGSVVAVQDDRTTISMAFDGEGIETEYYGQGPKTVTVGGTTYVGYEVAATAIVEDVTATATVDLACSRADGRAVPTCAITTKIDGGPSDVVSGLEDTTTTTMTGDEQYYLNNFQLVITAGEEKLGASAAATPSASEATPTGSSAQSSGTFAASGASTSSGASASSDASAAASAASNAASSGPAQATGAAAPMRSLAPVLVGMGAAAAFFI
ncbi:Mucin-21 [Didymella heteroderae]|uniref:Mucin-21 n=1 Tax=Didymella heteroderae TaxID=1769908 RepID=A0A9P4WGP6_9PLEO|nr:Mucin-21 [Didymella heteroderae]